MSKKAVGIKNSTISFNIPVENIKEISKAAEMLATAALQNAVAIQEVARMFKNLAPESCIKIVTN